MTGASIAKRKRHEPVDQQQNRNRQDAIVRGGKSVSLNCVIF